MPQIAVRFGIALSIIIAASPALAGQAPRPPAPRAVPFDPVAAIVATPRGPGYAYNRYSGQVYSSCVIDLGYGRTRPCDAGGR